MTAPVDRMTSPPLGTKVLVVEDDRLNAKILAGILQPEGYDVVTVESGEAALARYPEVQPALVLLDVVMPGIDGYETCRRLRATYDDNCAPIIFITAKGESDDVVEGLSAGGADYLPKPFRPKEAVARIKVHLQNRRLIEAQRRLVDQLNKSNAEKNRVLGMVAHDLRNPLGSISGLADWLRDGTVGDLTDEQRGLVDNIHVASQTMLDLINQLLDATVIQAGELRINRQPAALRELLEKSVYLNSINAAKKQTKITFDSAGCPAALVIDEKKIKQVVDNLLSNAVKFSPKGSVVSVTVGQSATHCTIAVRDQGPGIPENERSRLFQDFGTTSVRPTAGEQSIGLGLAICKKIAEAHGGTIGAENQPGGGCVFRLELPLNPGA